MTQPGETEGLSAADHVRAIIKHTRPDILDAVLLNSTTISVPEALERYKNENSFPVTADVDVIRSLGYLVFSDDVVGVFDYVRHDAHKLPQALIKVIEKRPVIRR